MDDPRTDSPVSERSNARREQLHLLSRHSPTVFAGTLVVSVLMIVALYTRVDPVRLASWAGLVWLLTAARFSVLRWLHARDGDYRRTVFWTVLFVLGSFFSGLLWGSAGVLFFDAQDPLVVAFVLIILAGMTAGSVASLSSYGATYVAFAVPAMLPVSVRLLLEPAGTHVVLGIAALVFLLVNLAYSRNIQAMVKETIKLRFENLDLLETLGEQRAQAEAARDEAERANKTKSQFLAAASHDLRQPVHALGLLLDAASSTQDDHERSKLFAKIGDSTDALEHLFDALLDISKLDAGVVEVEISDFHFDDIATRLRDEAAASALEKAIDLHFDEANVVLRSDPFLLERIVRNLLGNAIKFTPQGTVRLKTTEDDDFVTIDIIDSGPGIATADQQTIFLEFEQLHNPERDRRKGLGLGLAIVKRLCKLLQLEMHVISAPNQGSTFRLVVPKGDASVTATARSEHVARLWDMAGISVIVIEDEEQVAAATTAVLQSWGCSVECVSSLSEAVHLADQRTEPHDIILADYRLRDGVTGVEVVRKFRETVGWNIPALILTGDTARERLTEVAASGFLLLHKPVKSAELRVAMNKMLIR